MQNFGGESVLESLYMTSFVSQTLPRYYPSSSYSYKHQHGKDCLIFVFYYYLISLHLLEVGLPPITAILLNLANQASLHSLKDLQQHHADQTMPYHAA